ncbi:MAG: MarR family winged helix-turn-helix transcriptional regulator [Solirubrobacteraceae bacterium]
MTSMGNTPGMNHRPAHALPLLLLAGFRNVIEELHEELADGGHPHARPLYGFALQAIGAGGCSIGELGRRLGVSKQAAAKTAATLERLGYVQRVSEPGDRRVSHLQITSRGTELLSLSAEILAGIHAIWSDTLGADRLETLENDLEAIAGGTALALRLDLAGWLQGTDKQD